MMNSPAIFSDDLQNLQMKDSSEDDDDYKILCKQDKLNIKINAADFNNINSKPQNLNLRSHNISTKSLNGKTPVMSQKKSSRIESSLKLSIEACNQKDAQISKNQRKNKEIFQ
jgi:hypothetical protein